MFLIARAVRGIRKVQILCDICTCFARYLYTMRQSWIIKQNIRSFLCKVNAEDPTAFTANQERLHSCTEGLNEEYINMFQLPVLLLFMAFCVVVLCLMRWTPDLAVRGSSPVQELYGVLLGKTLYFHGLVPQDISIPTPWKVFMFEPSCPLEFPVNLHTFPYKFWLFRPPSPC